MKIGINDLMTKAESGHLDNLCLTGATPGFTLIKASSCDGKKGVAGASLAQ